MKKVISTLFVCCLLFITIFSGCTDVSQKKYDEALALMSEQKYEEAVSKFEEIKDYSDSAEKIMECRYNIAEALQKSGSYTEAIEIYTVLGEYRDSANKIAECNTAIKMKNLAVGDVISMGKYEQDNYTFNGAEPIEWRVLAIEDGKALVISDKVMYMSPYSGNSWEGSSLRSSLNSSFYNDSFTDAEKQKILLSDVKSEDNPKYGTQGGNDTKDHVFILSYSELLKYMPNDSDRAAEDVIYVDEKKKEFESGRGNGVDCSGRYWVRNQGSFVNCAMVVYGDGHVIMTGVLAYAYWMAARPAMWIEIGSN